MMNEKLLEIFLEVASSRNLTHSAKKLFMSQSTITYNLKAIEAEFGVKLFDRSGKEFRLTDAGEAFVTDAQEILNAYESAMQHMLVYKDTTKAFTIGCTPFMLSISREFLTLLFEKIQASLSSRKIAIKYNDGNLDTQSLHDGSADVIFTALMSEKLPKEYVTRYLFDSKPSVMIPQNSPLKKKNALSINDFTNQRIYYFDSEDSYVPILMNKLKRSPKKDLNFISVKSFDLVLLHVGKGDGIGLVTDAFPYQGVSYLPFDIDIVFPIHLVWLKEKEDIELLQIVEIASRAYRIYSTKGYSEAIEWLSS